MPADLEVGDIVTVPTNGTFVTHRIVEVTHAPGKATMLLRGDGNEVADATVYEVTSAPAHVLLGSLRSAASSPGSPTLPACTCWRPGSPWSSGRSGRREEPAAPGRPARPPRPPVGRPKLVLVARAGSPRRCAAQPSRRAAASWCPVTGGARGRRAGGRHEPCAGRPRRTRRRADALGRRRPLRSRGERASSCAIGAVDLSGLVRMDCARRAASRVRLDARRAASRRGLRAPTRRAARVLRAERRAARVARAGEAAHGPEKSSAVQRGPWPRPRAPPRSRGSRSRPGVRSPQTYDGPVTGPPRIGVLALQGDVREHLAMLRGLGADAVAVRRPAELADVDGLVLPGGESTTMSKLARTFDLLDPLRQAAKDGLPMFGTCAGMILLADRIEGGVPDQETIGGLDVVVRRNAFGRQVDSFEADLAVADLDRPVPRDVHPGALGGGGGSRGRGRRHRRHRAGHG